MGSRWDEIYRQHFQHFFRTPSDIQVYHGPDDVELKLAIHDWVGQSFRISSSIALRPLLARFTELMPERLRPGLKDFRVYASIGFAGKLFQNEENDFGEVVLYADVPDKEVPELLMNALFFILANRIPLGVPFSVGFGNMNPAFYRRYGKSALYFTHPADDDSEFNTVRSDSITVGRVFQAFFITPAEDAFLEAHGAVAFERAFRKQFESKFTAAEREQPEDEARFKELEAKVQEMWQQSRTAMSLRRPPCV